MAAAQRVPRISKPKQAHTHRLTFRTRATPLEKTPEKRQKPHGKGSRLPARKPATSHTLIKKAAQATRFTTIIKLTILEMYAKGDLALRFGIKSELEDAISKTFDSYVNSTAQGAMIGVQGENSVPEHKLYFAELCKLVKWLETVTGTTCPHPNVLGGFLLAQKNEVEWSKYVRDGLIDKDLPAAIDAWAMGATASFATGKVL